MCDPDEIYAEWNLFIRQVCKLKPEMIRQFLIWVERKGWLYCNRQDICGRAEVRHRQSVYKDIIVVCKFIIIII